MIPDLESLLLEGLASPPEVWTPEVRQAMCREAWTLIREAQEGVVISTAEDRQDAEAALGLLIDAGLADIAAGRVHEGEAVFDELLADQTDWRRLRTMTDDEAEAAALADPDAQPITRRLPRRTRGPRR